MKLKMTTMTGRKMEMMKMKATAEMKTKATIKSRKFLIMFLVATVLFAMVSIPTMAEDSIKVVLNGTELSFDVPPQLINDRTMVPMRKILEALGVTIEWDDDTQMVTARKGETVIVMQIDNPVISVSGEEITLDVPPQLVDSRTLVPVRAVAEGLDAEVRWAEETQTVYINKDEESGSTPQPTSADPAAYTDPTPSEPVASTDPTLAEPVASTDPTPSESIIVASGVGEYFWTPNGKSHHAAGSCSTLSRSKTIISGTLAEAIQAGKDDPCDICFR